MKKDAEKRPVWRGKKKKTKRSRRFRRFPTRLFIIAPLPLANSFALGQVEMSVVCMRNEAAIKVDESFIGAPYRGHCRFPCCGRHDIRNRHA